MNMYCLEEKLNAGEVGNKAAFLSLMKRNGFNVPTGIVLGNDIFTKTISANDNKHEVDMLLEVLSKSNAKETSDKISELYSSLKLHDEVKSEIEEKINMQKKYAVRSSGKEDLSGFSFAGQYDTVINAKGIDEISAAIIKCYLSAYSETVLSYIAANELSVDEIGMSVIIQEMIDSEVSGVAFTVNPTSGCDKEIFIEAAKGQGENLVSGKVAAERYSYNWWNKEITLSSGKLISDDK